MKNPAAIPRPKLINPAERKKGNGKGNRLFLRARRRLRRNMFR